MKDRGRRLWLKFSTTAAALTVEGLQANPVVPGVSLITEGPAKGHSCYDDVNDQMVPMYADGTTLLQVMQVAQATYASGLRVNVEHFSGITECCGYLSGLRVDGVQLRGDLNLFRTYSNFAHLCELVSTIPDTFGLSIDFNGEPEVVGGKGLARCEEIYSCDLVTEPAANPRGLFSSNLPPHIRAALDAVFDIPQKPDTSKPNPKPMPDPATPPPAPATPPPAAPAALTADDVKKLLDDALTPITTSLTNLTQRITACEASLAADDAAENAPAAYKSLRTQVTALSTTLGETQTKLARRMGIEFAARAGAAPVENPAGGNPEGETRKPWEIPSSERASRQLAGRHGN
ncbi:MAG: hypothetical protein ACFUZC_16550 [Chthoniobacteraceae bacterium]